MDLLLIARKIWRYKLATLPVIVLTLCGAVYAVAVKDPVYEASVQLRPDQSPRAADGGGDRRATRRSDASTRTTPIRALPTSRWSSRS